VLELGRRGRLGQGEEQGRRFGGLPGLERSCLRMFNVNVQFDRTKQSTHHVGIGANQVIILASAVGIAITFLCRTMMIDF
jgi:hypothetical protein